MIAACGNTARKRVTESEEERGRGRIRRINLTAVFAIAFRGAMLLSSFLYIPPAVHYLGSERYGLWVAMTSVVTLLAFADCGLGFSLMNEVAELVGRGNRDAVRRSVSSTFFVLAAVGIGGCLLLAAVYPWVPWQSVLRTRNAADTAEAARTVAMISAAFLVTLPFTTVQRVQSAHQEGYHTQAWDVGGVALGVLGLLAAIRLRAGLSLLAMTFTTGPLLAMVANWAAYFWVRRPSECPAWRFFHAGLARRIVRDGGYFLILQLAAAAIFSIDSFVILHYYGQAEFAKYSLAAKLFQVPPALVGVWFAALWPAYAEALARGDHPWVRRTLRHSIVLPSGACAVLSCGVAVTIRPLMRIWTGTVVEPSGWVLSGLALFSVLVVGTSAISTYLNGSNFIKEQAVLVLAVSALGVGLKIALCKYWNVAGAVWGSNLAYLLVAIPVYMVIVPRLLRRTHPQVPPAVQWSASLWTRCMALIRHALPVLMIGAIRKLTTRPTTMAAGDAPRILVTRLDGIGDFVMLTPFLRELRRNYPESQITLVTGRNAAPIAETCPYVDEVLLLDSSPARGSFASYRKYAAALTRHLGRLNVLTKTHLQNRVDVAIQPRWDVDLHWATLVTVLSGAPKRVGYGERTTPMKAWFNFGHDRCFTDVLPAGPEQHEVERNLDVIRHLGGSVAAAGMEVWMRPEDKAAAVRFLEENGRDALPVIAFGIGGTNPRHHWAHYAELIRLLSREIEFLPVIVAGPGEESLIDEIRRVCPHAAGTRSLPLRVVVAVISECALFIGNDTGPKHLAAAAGVPVIEISSHPAGGTRGYDGDPDRFGPRVKPADIIRSATALPGCESGCISAMPHCISTITPEKVAARAITLLSTIETRSLEISH